MKDNVRRALIFLVTVGAGSVFVFVDLPLILMIPLLVIIGLLLLILMGSLTPAEIAQGIRAIPRKLRGGKGKGPVKGAAKEPSKPKKAPAAGEKNRISGMFASLAGGLKKIKIPAVTKSAQDKKIREIDQKLEATLKPGKQSGKDTGSAAAGGAGGALAAAAEPSAGSDEEDPFLSLTGEDFDTGLLDELDEDEEPGLPSGSADTGSSADTLELPEDANGTPEELPETDGEPVELEGVDAIGDELSGLDDIDLDAMELDDEEEVSPSRKAAPKPAEEPAEPAAAAPEEKKIDANIGFDNAMMQEQIPEQIDVAAMAGPVGSDDEMLSLLAAEAKVARKQDNDSLLRDLKDFKAPAEDIESELQDVMNLLGAKTGKKNPGKSPVGNESVSSDE